MQMYFQLDNNRLQHYLIPTWQRLRTTSSNNANQTWYDIPVADLGIEFGEGRISVPAEFEGGSWWSFPARFRAEGGGG